jgi:outer membrane lipoprotein carrier protein
MESSVPLCIISGRRTRSRCLAILNVMNRLGARAASFLWNASPIRLRLRSVSWLRFVGLLSILAALTVPSSRAQTAPVANAAHWVALLEARYRAATTTQAAFLERYMESGRLERVEAGQAYFRRPGKMRWEYASPEKNLFLVDGKTAWFYVPADRSVTRVPAKQSADWRTPLALLAGEMKVSRVCSLVTLAANEKPNNPGNVVLACQLRGTPKANSADTSSPEDESRPKDTSVFLEVAPDTGDLARVLVRDKGGIAIEFRFENWQFNPILAASEFEFHPPAGVAILNGELPLQNETMK